MVDLLKRLLRTPQGATGLILITLVFIVVAFGPWLAPAIPKPCRSLLATRGRA